MTLRFHAAIRCRRQIRAAFISSAAAAVCFAFDTASAIAMPCHFRSRLMPTPCRRHGRQLRFRHGAAPRCRQRFASPSLLISRFTPLPCRHDATFTLSIFSSFASFLMPPRFLLPFRYFIDISRFAYFTFDAAFADYFRYFLRLRCHAMTIRHAATPLR
jgi:hypothetical protein